MMHIELSVNGSLRVSVNFLKHNIQGKYRPEEVLKTGSIAKGTAIKGKSDVDLVFFVVKEPVHQRAVSFETVCRESGTGHSHVISVDLLPAVNFGDLVNLRSIHTQMRIASEEVRNMYTPSLTKWQREFVKRDRTEQLKKLIRFVKYWKNESIQNSTSSFAIELLVIRLWSQDGFPVHFKLTNALKKVMETIAVPNHIRVEFVGEFYNREFQKV
ncbi:OAS [Mytilus edulis]|uniref:OAS n=1 Tax=Mytilus edulis TaxID=6550 RepID=A0A8S3QJM0_MYTED|nr:OAS [Mytilus edulis]